uniref:Ig-like domain-containing protein n=1 Tax=Salarias fasciatus TaxID=181472 RepID=A0A672IY10_SALFA
RVVCASSSGINSCSLTVIVGVSAVSRAYAHVHMRSVRNITDRFCSHRVFPGNVADASCELKVTPPRVVVRYGSPLLATCSSTSDIEGVGWESSYGGTGLIKDVSSLALNISSVETWELEPQCYASLRSDGSQCLEKLPVTVYKLPKSVSLSQPSGGGGPMVEGQQYKINCYIANVAPRKNLSVNWYKGNTIFQIDRFREASLSPDDISSEISITAHRNDSGADLWCEAKLTFKSVEQNPPPMCSQSKKLNVLLELIAGETTSLNCAAMGNPTPVYRWGFPEPTQDTNKQRDIGGPVLTVRDPGTYSCTASNSQGSSTKYFSVVQTSGQLMLLVVSY